MKLKYYNNLYFSIPFFQTFSHAFLHGHEQFDIDSDRLLKTIWESNPKLK
jgi:hypothetical protein